MEADLQKDRLTNEFRILKNPPYDSDQLFTLNPRDDLFAWVLGKLLQEGLALLEGLNWVANELKFDENSKLAIERKCEGLKHGEPLVKEVDAFALAFPDLQIILRAVANNQITLPVSESFLGYVVWANEYDEIHKRIKAKLTGNPFY